jgi:hypothetical protein
MGYVDGPLDSVLAQVVGDEEELLRVRAWEVEESPEDLGYSLVKDWPNLPNGWRLGQVAGVAVDHLGHYYLYHRGEEAPPLICFDRAGEYIRSWGEGVFGRPHMAKCDGEGDIWLIDDGGHALYLHSMEGEVVRKLGTPRVPGEDGVHFNRPTDIAFGLNGGFYVSDGYGNRRVARFDAGLNFHGQWGSEGEGEGQFVLPHAITVGPKGRVYVADRTKWRVEIFSPEGVYLRQVDPHREALRTGLRPGRVLLHLRRHQREGDEDGCRGQDSGLLRLSRRGRGRARQRPRHSGGPEWRHPCRPPRWPGAAVREGLAIETRSCPINCQ